MIDDSAVGNGFGRAPASERYLPVADGFDLDLVARELRHDGRAVHLRPREFELLAAFAAHPGRALSSRQLMDLAWDVHGDVGPRAVMSTCTGCAQRSRPDRTDLST